MTKILDITLPLTMNMPVWPGEPKMRLDRVSSIEKGNAVNVSRLEIMVHTGTHVDAPCHFIDGQEGVEELPMSALVGPVLVVQVHDECDVITDEILRAIDLKDCQRILFKTSNSYYWKQGGEEFQTGYVGLDTSAAMFLVNRGVLLVGIDYLSIAAYHDQINPHRVLLSSGVVILEGVNLSDVSPGYYSLFCLPLKLNGSDGAPTRAILIEE